MCLALIRKGRKGKSGEGEKSRKCLCKTQIVSAAPASLWDCCAPTLSAEDSPGAKAALEARLHDPLIGRAGPPVNLFCLSGQGIKAAAAALGTVLPRLGYPLLGGLVKQLQPATPDRLNSGGDPAVHSCEAAATCKRDPLGRLPEHPLASGRAQVKKEGAGIAWRWCKRGGRSAACTARHPSWRIENCEVWEGAFAGAGRAEVLVAGVRGGAGREEGGRLGTSRWVGFA